MTLQPIDVRHWDFVVFYWNHLGRTRTRRSHCQSHTPQGCMSLDTYPVFRAPPSNLCLISCYMEMYDSSLSRVWPLEWRKWYTCCRCLRKHLKCHFFYNINNKVSHITLNIIKCHLLSQNNIIKCLQFGETVFRESTHGEFFVIQFWTWFVVVLGQGLHLGGGTHNLRFPSRIPQIMVKTTFMSLSPTNSLDLRLDF